MVVLNFLKKKISGTTVLNRKFPTHHFPFLKTTRRDGTASRGEGCALWSSLSTTHTQSWLQAAYGSLLFFFSALNCTRAFNGLFYTVSYGQLMICFWKNNRHFLRTNFGSWWTWMVETEISHTLPTPITLLILVFSNMNCYQRGSSFSWVHSMLGCTSTNSFTFMPNEFVSAEFHLFAISSLSRKRGLSH